MTLQVTPNVVVCPHCEQPFQYNRVNGLALLEIANGIEQRKRTRIRLTIDALEREYGGTVPPAVRKAILDGYNDLARDIHTLLGFGTQAE